MTEQEMMTSIGAGVSEDLILTAEQQAHIAEAGIDVTYVGNVIIGTYREVKRVLFETIGILKYAKYSVSTGIDSSRSDMGEFSESMDVETQLIALAQDTGTLYFGSTLYLNRETWIKLKKVAVEITDWVDQT